MLVCICCVLFAPGISSALVLPDSRGYELVSPRSPGGGGVFPLSGLTHSLEQFGRPMQSAATGSTVTYVGEDFYLPRLGSLDQYASSLGPVGWLTQNLTPGVPSSAEQALAANRFVGFSPDLSRAVISSRISLTEEAPTGFANLYLFQGGNVRPLITGAPLHRSPTTFGHARYGQSEDIAELLFAGGNNGTNVAPAFSHILFEANDALTPANIFASAAIDGGELENNLYEWFDGSLRLVNVLPNGETEPNAAFGIDNGDTYNIGLGSMPSLANVISADGSRIFWTDENTGNLYVREDGKRTVLIAAGAEFQTASVDGSIVVFTKEERLYEYNTVTESTAELAAGGVQGILGTSADASYVYFVDMDALGEIEGPVAEQPNLYLSHGGKLTYIVTLSRADNRTPNLYGTSEPYGDWFRTFAGRTAEVSPNGEYVAFMSKAKLTAYENKDASGIGRDYEVYLYSLAAKQLVCVSCNTNGTSPTRDTLLPSATNGVYEQRYLNNGGQLFFSTKDAVLPQDVNGNSDVYEYEGGHIYLLSPAEAPEAEAVFADASENGNDVYFTTEQSLLPDGQGEMTALYDARVGGYEEKPYQPLQCSSEACHSGPSTPQSFVPPSSAVFTGAGNPISTTSPSAKTVRSAPLARKQKLALALRACNRRSKPRRAACIRKARGKYGLSGGKKK